MKKVKGQTAAGEPPDDDNDKDKGKGKEGEGNGNGEGEGNGEGAGTGTGEGAGKGAEHKPGEGTIPKKPGTAGGEPIRPATEQPQSEYDKGVAAERARVSALQALDRPATHAIVTKAIADGKQVADIVAECMEAMDKAKGRDARHADASVLAGIPPANGADDDNDFGQRIKKKAQARVKGRNPLRANRN